MTWHSLRSPLLVLPRRGTTSPCPPGVQLTFTGSVRFFPKTQQPEQPGGRGAASAVPV